MKILFAILAVVTVAGCTPDVKIEDEGPDWNERRRAWDQCTGNYKDYEIPDDVRIACTDAIYGR